FFGELWVTLYPANQSFMAWLGLGQHHGVQNVLQIVVLDGHLPTPVAAVFFPAEYAVSRSAIIFLVFSSKCFAWPCVRPKWRATVGTLGSADQSGQRSTMWSLNPSKSRSSSPSSATRTIS